MNEQKVYQKIGELLWSIMVEDAKIIFCEGFIYPDTNSYSFEWINRSLAKVIIENLSGLPVPRLS